MDLYKMGLDGVVHLGTIEPYEVLRVPGGWIYTRFVENGAGGYNISSCYVPFNNEFMGRRE